MAAPRAQGSFRGVPFYHQSSDDELGRRTVVKEFPGRDLPYVEDLGRGLSKFTLDMFVLGRDVDAQRDRLLAALQTAGPGQLVHPYHGTKQVSVIDKIRLRQATGEQRIARFTVSFVEVGDPRPLIDRAAPAGAVAAAAARAKAASTAAFAKKFSVLGAALAAVQKATILVQDAARTINSVRGKIAAALQVVNDLQGAVQAVADGASALIRTPATLAASIQGLVESVLAGIDEVTDAVTATLAVLGLGGADAVAAAGSVVSNLTRTNALTTAAAELGVFGAAFTVLPTSTGQERIAATNQTAMVTLLRSLAACEVANQATALTFDSADQARELRDVLTTTLDTVLVDPDLDDDQYVALADLRAATVDYLDQAAATSDELEAYVPPQTTPALLVAYHLYGDAAREVELLLRNQQVRDPTAVTGGLPLTVKHV